MSCKSRDRILVDLKDSVSKLKNAHKESKHCKEDESFHRIKNREEKRIAAVEKLLQDYRTYAQLPKDDTPEQELNEKLDLLEHELREGKKTEDNLRKSINRKNDDYTRIKQELEETEEKCIRIQEEFRKKEEQCCRLQEKAQKEEHKNKEVLVKFSDTKRDYESQEKKISSLIRQNDEYKQQLEDRNREVERQNKEIQKNEEEKRNLNDNILSLKLANDDYTQANTRLKNTIESFKRSLQESEHKRTALRQAIETNKSQMEDLNQQLLESEKEIRGLKEELESRNQDITKQQGTINSLHKNVVSERRAKEEALTRLSAAAASRLRDNNPGITDLSDPNRPLKLAEKISELYDNEWTNAMETLEDIGVEEEEGVRILLNIFTSMFVKCSDLASEHFDKLQCKLILPSKVWKSAMTKTELDDIPKLPTEVFKPLKDFRKTYADKAVIVLQEVLMKEIKDTKSPILEDLSEEQINACEEFVQKCIEICWKMRVQDPPVSMKWDFPENDKFPTDIMRSYTKSGKLVDFIVWPVIYLHKDGPLLAKGVMQGKKENSQNGKNKSQASNGNPPDDNKPSAESGNTEETQVDGSHGNEIREPSTSGKSSSASMTSSDTNNESEI